MASRPLPGIDRWGFPVPQELQLLPAPQPPKPEPRTQRGIGSFSEETLLPGLRELCTEVRYGETLTRAQISRRCKVSKDTIRLLERSAIRKIRSRLTPAELAQALEFLRTRLSDDNLRHVSNSR